MMSKSQTTFCYVALGSNLGDSVAYLSSGLQALADHSQLANLNISRLYQSKPHGPQDQPDYINAVVEFETILPAEILLDELQKIENDHGRVRKGAKRWGARTLDLDLLFYGCHTIKTERLTVPHPRICERTFVLYPLRDLIRNKNKQDNASLTEMIQSLLNTCIDRLSLEDKKGIQGYKTND